MAKKRLTKQGFSIQGFDVQAYKQTESYVQAIDVLYNQAVAEFARLASRTNINPDKPFSFDDYPSTQATAQSIVNQLASKMQAVIEKGSREQWLYACKKNDEFVASIMNTSMVSKALLNKMQDRNLDALEAFQKRKVGGLDLSKRVWKYAGQFRDTMEMGIDVGIGEGKSAQQLSKDLRQNLQDPDQLFRRVRDKRGQLHLSKAAKAFHPGQGIYRSSYKNAMRLTRSEINMAYKQADQLRWQNLEFVVGYEVRLSNNHTLNGKPFKDICDKLAGRYPKNFVFKGWHPQCRCLVVPILQDPDEFDKQELDELKAALKGSEYKKYSSRNLVEDVPDNFKEWIDENKQASKNWSSQPYFIQDNFKGGTIAGGLNIVKPTIVKPEVAKVDLVSQELALLASQIAEIKNRASEYGSLTMALDNYIAKKDIAQIVRQLKSLKSSFDDLDSEYRIFKDNVSKSIQEAKKYEIEVDVSLSSAFSKRDWYSDLVSYETKLENLDKMIKTAKIGKNVSANMPIELKTKGEYLHGEDYTFDNRFFDLINPNNPIRLVVSKRNDGAYYSPLEKTVHLFDAKRNERSAWERKAVVYHEFGHAIDWQRNLRNSKEVTEMRAIQIARLKKQGVYKVLTRRYDYDKGKYVTERQERKMSVVAFIDQKLQAISSKVWGMRDETFTKRGITKMDVMEQIASVRDTIKSLVISYGDGHSTKYFRGPGKQEAEYLAHAFENAFVGNEVFKKYLPETYNEMVAYIHGLK